MIWPLNIIFGRPTAAERTAALDEAVARMTAQARQLEVLAADVQALVAASNGQPLESRGKTNG